MRCERCPAGPGCLVFTLFGEEGCAGHLAARVANPHPPHPPSPTAAPAPPLRPLAEALELRLLIQECPHLIPKQPGDGCGCIGRCQAGRGDMDAGRTSYRNCESCQAGELEVEG